MPKTAVMFSDVDCLDNFEHRLEVLKLPEVISCIEEAQLYLDDINSSISLLDYLSAPDEVFHAHHAVKALIGTAVQVGLYNRLIKFNNKPDYLIGYSLGDIARTVCAGGFTIEQLMNGRFREGEHSEIFAIPMISTANCSLIQSNDELVEDMNNEVTELDKWNKAYRWMIEELGVRRFISIGPTDSLIRLSEKLKLRDDIEVIDSLQLEKQKAACSERSFVDTIGL